MSDAATLTKPRAQTRDELVALIQSTKLGDTPSSMRAGFADIMRGQTPGTAGDIGGVSGLSVGQGELKAVWLHGGGYVFGSAQTHTFAAERLAGLIEGRIFLPDYRLAPEHVWPAPMEDGTALLDALEAPVAVIGDSAGGHLALQLALEKPDKISRLVLFSSNTDRSGRSETRRPHSRTDMMNDDATDRDLFEMACPGADPASTAASPLLADLTGLPPTYLCVGSHEVLLDDTLLLARELGLAGVSLRLDVLDGLWHMFWQWPDLLPQAQSAIESAARHIRN